MSHLARSILVAAVMMSLPLGRAQTPTQGSLDPSTAAPEKSDVIGDGDMLDITVFESTDLSTKARVGDDGEVLLPLVGRMHLQGLTVMNASALIRTRLIDQKFVKDPKVTVSISEYATRGVSVMGEVKKPGIYMAMGSHRLNDYISLAEGLTPQAGTRVSITHRVAPDQTKTIQISSLGNARPGSNPIIDSGDTIVIPKAGEVYVVGDVVRPGKFLMDHDEQLTIVQALALAQGANKTALLKHSVLIRKTDAGRTEIPLNVEKVLSMKSKDLALLDNDILFIPVSKAKTAINRSLEAIVQTAVGAASYRTF